jgi:sugar phosphate isomerase/epimerase
MIAAQLYTLRDFTKTPADIASTLKRVKQIGYDGVQLSALGPIDPRELKKILDNEGLTVTATHTPLDRMEKEPQRVIEDHQIWNCNYTALGGFFPKEAVTQDWINFATRMNNIVQQYDASPLRVGYHNHSHELARFDGRSGLDIFLEHFSKNIWMEIDTYWIAHGGGDPAAWIRKVSGRIPCVHLKDMGIKLDRTQFMAEVGEGNLNWPEILRACKDAQVEHLLVEQDICYRDPFQSLAISLKNLKEWGAG